MRKKPVTKEYSYCAGLGTCIKIVQLSDLHNCSFGTDNDRLLEYVRACEPDLIFITGDMLNKKDKDYHTALNTCRKIASVAPTFYCLGNHEIRFSRTFKKQFETYAEELIDNGIRFLKDDSLIIEVQGKEIEIGCFNADEKAYGHFKPIPFYDNIPKRKNPEIPGLLLSHNPELYKSYEASQWDVVFSGHLHGGIVRIPFIGGCVSPSGRIFPKYSGGFYTLKNNRHMLVSCGLGSHTIKIRLFNPPEITKLTLS